MCRIQWSDNFANIQSNINPFMSVSCELNMYKSLFSNGITKNKKQKKKNTTQTNKNILIEAQFTHTDYRCQGIYSY